MTDQLVVSLAQDYHRMIHGSEYSMARRDSEILSGLITAGILLVAGIGMYAVLRSVLGFERGQLVDGDSIQNAAEESSASHWNVVTDRGYIAGAVYPDGDVIDHGGFIAGRVHSDGDVTNHNGSLVGHVDDDGTITNDAGYLEGRADSDGDIIAHTGGLYGNALWKPSPGRGLMPIIPHDTARVRSKGTGSPTK